MLCCKSLINLTFLSEFCFYWSFTETNLFYLHVLIAFFQLRTTQIRRGGMLLLLFLLFYKHFLKFSVTTILKICSFEIFSKVFKRILFSQVVKYFDLKCRTVLWVFFLLYLFSLNSLVAKEKSSLLWKVDKWDYDDFGNFLPDLSKKLLSMKRSDKGICQIFLWKHLI